MKTFNKKTGALGETLAVLELEKKGYQILERNFGNKWGEVDIITKEANVLVFVEVKTKIGTDFGLPEEMINPKKLGRIRNMANIYTGGKEITCRVDIIAIVLNPDNSLQRLTHYENVY